MNIKFSYCIVITSKILLHFLGGECNGEESPNDFFPGLGGVDGMKSSPGGVGGGGPGTPREDSGSGMGDYNLSELGYLNLCLHYITTSLILVITVFACISCCWAQALHWKQVGLGRSTHLPSKTIFGQVSSSSRSRGRVAW